MPFSSFCRLSVVGNNFLYNFYYDYYLHFILFFISYIFYLFFVSVGAFAITTFWAF